MKVKKALKKLSILIGYGNIIYSRSLSLNDYYTEIEKERYVTSTGKEVDKSAITMDSLVLLYSLEEDNEVNTLVSIQIIVDDDNNVLAYGYTVKSDIQ